MSDINKVNAPASIRIGPCMVISERIAIFFNRISFSNGRKINQIRMNTKFMYSRSSRAVSVFADFTLYLSMGRRLTKAVPDNKSFDICIYIMKYVLI